MCFGFCSILIPFTISVLCAIRITRKLHEVKVTTNMRKRKMQNDVTKILSIQLFLPFLGFGIPLFLRQCSILFNISLPISLFFAYIVVWSPTLNSIFIILIIEPYKIKTLQLLKSICSGLSYCRLKKTTLLPTIKVTPLSGNL